MAAKRRGDQTDFAVGVKPVVKVDIAANRNSVRVECSF